MITHYRALLEICIDRLNTYWELKDVDRDRVTSFLWNWDRGGKENHGLPVYGLRKYLESLKIHHIINAGSLVYIIYYQ